jgi:ABC-type amino acid transport substrate-binding protein
VGTILNKCIVFLLVFLLGGLNAWATDSAQPLTIVYNKGIAPIKFTTQAGKPSGILNEYWLLLAEKAGLNLQFKEVDSFDESLEMVKNGKADLHAGVFRTEAREQILAFSQPVLNIKYYLYSSPDLPIFSSIAECKGYVLGVVQGGYTESFIKKNAPKAHLVIYDDFSSLFEAVLAGDIKVFVASDIHLNYYLSSKKVLNPFKHQNTALYEQTYYGAAAKVNQPLIEKIMAAQGLLTDQELLQLKDRWLNAKVEDAVIPKIRTLNPAEISWITEHPVIRVSNEMDWPPFDFNQNGQPLGLSIDLLNMIADRTGLKIDYRSGYSWNELQEMLKRKELDIIHSLTKSDERAKFMSFTNPYVTNQTALITTVSNNDIHAIGDLEHKTIAVIKGYYQEQVLTKTLGTAYFLYVDSPLAALKAVSSGRADATIRFLGVANYLINHHLLTNLKFVNEFTLPDGKQSELFFGVRDDWPILRDILQKGLDSLSQEEMDNLRRKWITLGSAPQQTRITMSDAEQQWLHDHPKITLGSDYKWPPFDFADQNGLHSGLSADFIRLVAQRTGLDITVRTGVWADILKEMQKGQLDGLTCAVKTKDRTDRKSVV